jgi:hypothetical protein
MLRLARMPSAYRPATENNASASSTTDVTPEKTVAAVKAVSLISLRDLRTRFSHILITNSPSNAGISILHQPAAAHNLKFNHLSLSTLLTV